MQRAEGKVKDAECFKDNAARAASISELLIISINGLMHLFRAVKTAQGLVSLTLPSASRGWFPTRERESQSLTLFLFASRIKIETTTTSTAITI